MKTNSTLEKAFVRVRGAGRVFILAAALLPCLFCGCTSGKNTKAEQEQTLSLNGLSEQKWTYFCFSSGEVVGQSTFESSEEDSLWASRLDWDFAIAGDYLKTNGGTSGKGLGGVQRIGGTDYSSLTTAPTSGYIIDTLGVVR